MTHEEALSFANGWAAAWNRVDIDGVADHFAPDAELTSPLAARLAGTPTIRGRERIRQYWRQAYGDVAAPRLTLEAAAWVAELSRLIVWWRAELPGGTTRACEHMDFDDAGRVVRAETYYGAPRD